jgi:NAD(P)-dependent dehydrogenase (short-subunit alcohol dehydrogenase family)
MSGDISGKAALVTGGTDGIGKAVALGLAHAGHRVIVVGRDHDKGIRVRQEIEAKTGNPDVSYIQADLSLVRGSELLAEQIVNRIPALHYLVHSAGIVLGRRVMTDEGVESNFAVNYLARFVLTLRLLPLLHLAGSPGKSARIVLISGAAQHGTIYHEDVNLGKSFTTLRAVMQFCLANDVFAIELARRLEALQSNSHVTITCLKVGVVKTNIRRGFPWWMKLLVPLILDPLLAQSPQEAADAALRLLLAPDYEGTTGALFLKIRKFRQLIPARHMLDPGAGRRLWELSQRLSSLAVS